MEGFYRFCGMVWGGFLRFLATFAWPVSISAGLAVSVLLVVMYWGGSFSPKKTVESERQETIQKASKEERELIAAAIVRDAMYENEPIRVQEGVGWAVLNFRKEYGVGIANIVAKSLTMIPVNYERKEKFFETKVWYVRRVEATKEQWTEALKMADNLVEKGSAALSDKSLVCVTQYIRKKRDTREETEEARSRLIAELKEVPKPAIPNAGEARFFCPKK